MVEGIVNETTTLDKPHARATRDAVRRQRLASDPHAVETPHRDPARAASASVV
jgi:hypothetical protein